MGSNQRMTGTQMAARRRELLLRGAGEVSLLPSTLVVPMRVLQLHRRAGTDLGRYGEVLSADPSLVAKVLGLVNSKAFGPAAPVTRFSTALAMIGLKNLLPMLFGVSLGGIFNKLALPAEERGVLWRAAVLKAVTARAWVSDDAPELAEEAFVAGLMQDVALPLVHGVDRSAWPETSAILEMADAAAAGARERAMNGADHAELGAAIAKRLGLPRLYQDLIAHHHAPARLAACAGIPPVLAKAVSAAAALPHRLTGTAASLRGRVLAAVGKADDPAELSKRIVATYSATLEELGDADERSVAFKEFMQGLCSEVALCMEGAIGASTTTITELKDRGADLERRMEGLKQEVIRSEYDALTGVLNRRGFLRRAGRFLSVASEYEARCALGFADIDDFKQLNDGHGHDAGDRALVALAKGLTAACRGRGIVGRMGGDEFCFVLFAKDEAGLSESAARIESAFCKMEVEVGGDAGTVAVTSSVGVVRLERSAASSEAELERVLKRADELMYGAKRAGKGRCEIRLGAA
jgi:two-component system, cell cycle response regulator